MATGKKDAKRLNAHLVFLDEAGFQLMPSVQRTWAPVGQTPILKHWTTREKLSVISAITLSPKRHRLGLYYQIHGKNIQQLEVVQCPHRGWLKPLAFRVRRESRRDLAGASPAEGIGDSPS